MGNSGLSTSPASMVQNGFPCCNENSSLAPIVKCLLLFGRAAAPPSLPSTWDFSTPGANLCASVEPHKVSSGPDLRPSNVVLIEALPFGVPSHPPNLMSSPNLLACSLCPCPGHWWGVDWHGPQNWSLQGCPCCWVPAGCKPLINALQAWGFGQFSAHLTPFIQAVFPFERYEKYLPTQ